MCSMIYKSVLFSTPAVVMKVLQQPAYFGVGVLESQGLGKWILYNNMEWKCSWGQWNEPPSTTSKFSLHLKKVTLCIWWDWKGVFYYELLLGNQMINSNKYCSQLDQLKAAPNKKHPELVNRKCKIFHQDTARPYFFDDQAKTVTAWLGSSDSSATFTRHCTFEFPFIFVFTKFS